MQNIAKGAGVFQHQDLLLLAFAFLRFLLGFRLATPARRSP